MVVSFVESFGERCSDHWRIEGDGQLYHWSLAYEAILAASARNAPDTFDCIVLERFKCKNGITL